MYNYCTGIRVNDVFQERNCEHREHCPYYTNVNLSVAFSRPDEYQELNTYNDTTCKYFDKSWNILDHQKNETSSTLDILMGGKEKG